MKISAVIPAYHSASTIGDALDSVAAQQHDALEIIVVDDCSADQTPAAVRAWNTQRNPARIPLRVERTTKNGGPAVARNLGIKNARGDWIAFLDADDAWLPGKIEAQLAAIETFRAQNQGVIPSLVCGATEPWSGEQSNRATQAAQDENPPILPTGSGHRKRPTSPTSPTCPTLQATPGIQRLVLKDFATANPVATSTVLVRRDVLKAVGGFDEQFRGPEDYDLWMRVAGWRPRTEEGSGKTESGAVLLKLETPLARYRAVPGSLSLDDRRFLPQVLRVLEKAYAPGGALREMPEQRTASESTQYWSASWMAYQRGDRRRAIAYWYKAWRLNRQLPHPVKRRWYPLLLRYATGKR